MALKHETLVQIRALSDRLTRQAHKAIANAPKHDVIWGVVDSISAGPPKTLSLFLAGSATSLAGFRYLSSYVPTVGDTVFCSKYGRDVVVIGAMSGVSKGIVIPQSYAVQGSLSAETLPIFYVPVPAGQTVEFLGIRAKVATGTSVNVDILRNGSGITGLTGLTITTTSTSHTLGTPLDIADNDEFGLVINSVSGTPGVLSCGNFFSVSG